MNERRVRPRTESFSLVVGTTNEIDQGIDFLAYAVEVDNYTNQWVELPDIGRFVPPSQSRTFSLDGTHRAQARFSAPGTTVQPAIIAGQTCALVFSGAERPTTGGPVGVALANYYDRNATSLLREFALTAAPHGGTQRWSYTVPANRAAWQEATYAEWVRVTAAAPADSAVVEIDFNLVSGGGISTLIELRATDNVIGNPHESSFSAVGLLATGDALVLFSADASTGGSILYNGLAKFTEFDR